jgi:hypothetical protein
MGLCFVAIIVSSFSIIVVVMGRFFTILIVIILHRLTYEPLFFPLNMALMALQIILLELWLNHCYRFYP